MERDVDEMQRLIDAFLDFARDGAPHGEPETLPTRGFVEGVVEDCGGRAATRRCVDGDTEEAGDFPSRCAQRALAEPDRQRGPLRHPRRD